MSVPNDEAERMIRSACEEQRFEHATALAFEAYGTEIFTFLVGRLRNESDAEEAFGMFAEDLCKAMPGFAFRCSVRGYLYTLARNAANRYTMSPQNRRARNGVLTSTVPVSAMIERARTVTEAYRRTDVKDKVRALRDQLSDADQLLLTLHVDRRLPWREIAIVMHDGAEPLSDEDTDRESARLRKRYERVKAELRAMAVREGLLER